MLLTDDEGIRSGALWGLGFMAACVIFFLANVIADNSSSFIVRLIAVEIGSFLVFFTAIMHIRGFAYLGSKLNSSFLKWSSYAFCTALGTFCLAMTITLPFVNNSFFDAMGTFVAVLVWIAGIAFMIAIVKLYKRLGVFVFPIALNIFWMYFIWLQVLLAILIIIPSTYLLYRESNT